MESAIRNQTPMWLLFPYLCWVWLWAREARCFSSLNTLPNSESPIVEYVVSIIIIFMTYDTVDCLSIPFYERFATEKEIIYSFISSNISSAGVAELSDPNVICQWILQILVWTFRVVCSRRQGFRFQTLTTQSSIMLMQVAFDFQYIFTNLKLGYYHFANKWETPKNNAESTRGRGQRKQPITIGGIWRRIRICMWQYCKVWQDGLA